jgi:hypothetical protein
MLAVAMETELAALPQGGDPASQARAGLRAIGAGYLRFAWAETGLFRTAFGPTDGTRGAADRDMAGRSGLNPFQLLGAALDRMMRAGVLPPERRLGAEYLAWSAVHGLSMLVIDGVVPGLDDSQTQQIGQRLLEMVESGI